jgi:hypothetical protein
MGSVIGDVLPLGVGVAISPMSIIKIVLGAVIVLLGVKQWRGRSRGGAMSLANAEREAGVVTRPRGQVSARPPSPTASTCSLRPPARPHGAFVVQGTGTAPEWNVRLKPWGGREGHDYGRNDQS